MYIHVIVVIPAWKGVSTRLSFPIRLFRAGLNILTFTWFEGSNSLLILCSHTLDTNTSGWSQSLSKVKLW